MSRADQRAETDAAPALQPTERTDPHGDGLDGVLSASDDPAAAAAWGVRRDVVATARTIAGLAPANGRQAALRWLSMQQRHRAPAETTHRLLAWLLEDARKRDGLSGAVDALLANMAGRHIEAASDAAPPSREWRAQRERAMGLADQSASDLDKASAELAATAAWSIEDASTVLSESLSQWFLPLNGFSATRVSRNPNPKGPDAQRLKAAWAEEARSQAEAINSFLDGAEVLLGGSNEPPRLV